MKIKYEVIPVERYMAVRFEINEDGKIHKSETCGEFQNGSLAYSTACAMAYTERDNPPEGVSSVIAVPNIPGWLATSLLDSPPRFNL